MQPPKKLNSSVQIKLMKEGRMKGQAFVTFPTKELAGTALRNVHGYVLHEKPMIVVRVSQCFLKENLHNI